MVEEDLQWRTILGGTLPVVEDNLQWKMTFSGRRPLMEDDLRWKSTFGGRKHLVEDNLRWKTTFGGSLHAAYSALRQFFFWLKQLIAIMVWTRLCSDCHGEESPLKVVFHQRLSPTKGHLSPKVVFH